MRGDRALGILGSAISPNSSAASVDQSKKKITVIESQLSGSLSPSQIYPRYFLCSGNAYLFNGARVTISKIATSSSVWGLYYVVASGWADLDEYTVSMPLAAGDYEIDISYLKATSGGIFDVYFDGVEIISNIDTYNGSTTYNNIANTAFTVTTDGLHELMIKIDGRHASSSSWRFHSVYAEIVPA